MAINRWKLLGAVKTVVWVVGLVVLFAGVAPRQSTAAEHDPVSRIEILWRSGERAAAHAVIDSLLPVARARVDTSLTGRLLVLRGLMHTALGNGSRGEDPLREGLALVRDTGDPRWEMIALRWLGVALGQNLKDDAARRVFAELRDLAGTQGDPEMQAWAETGLAYQDRREGRLQTARAGYKRAVALFRECDQVSGELFALNGLGNVLNRLAEYDAARQCYEETLTASRRVGATFTEALAANNIGTLDYSLGDPGRALANFRLAYELQMQGDNLREAINASHNIAVCLTFLGDYDQALAVLEEAVRVCRERGFRELEYAALTQEGLVLAMQDRLGLAVAVFRDLKTWPETMPTEHILEMVLAYATALGRQNRHAESLRLLRDHVAAFRTYRNPAQRLAFLARMGEQLNETGQHRAAVDCLLPVVAAADSLRLNDTRLLALPELGVAYLALGRPDSALGSYRQAATVWEYERGLPLDPQWRERRGVAGQGIYTELAALVLAGFDTTVTPTGRVQEAYTLLQAFKGRTLLERMVGPRLSAPDPPSPAGLVELQQALAVKDEVLLDYFVGRRRSFLFVVTSDSLTVHELPPAAELQDRVRLYRDLVLAPGLGRQGASLQAAGTAAMAGIILQPAAMALAANHRVVYCPDGDLNRLPMGLVLGEPESRHEVQRVPSASILVRLRRGATGRSRPLRRLLAVAGTGRNGGRTLADASREVAWIQRNFNGVDSALPDSTDAVAALAGYDLIHVASHARVSDEFPWRSSIFARAASGAEYTLAAADIAVGRLSAGLTVLAGCESAGGKTVRGEGVMGLSSAFIAAGSPVVVASLWPIDDAATYQFMRVFYADLADGVPVAVACRQARESLARQTGFGAPRFWAGFVVIGDGDRCFDLVRRHVLLRWELLMLIGVVLFVAAVVLGRYQARGRFL